MFALLSSSNGRTPLSKQIEWSIGGFFVVTIGLIIVLALTFLMQSNKNATRGYELRLMQERRAELIQANEVLAMQIAEQKALRNIENTEIVRRMVAAPEPLYIEGASAVARNQ